MILMRLSRGGNCAGRLAAPFTATSMASRAGIGLPKIYRWTSEQPSFVTTAVRHASQCLRRSFACRARRPGLAARLVARDGRDDRIGIAPRTYPPGVCAILERHQVFGLRVKIASRKFCASSLAKPAATGGGRLLHLPRPSALLNPGGKRCERPSGYPVRDAAAQRLSHRARGNCRGDETPLGARSERGCFRRSKIEDPLIRKTFCPRRGAEPARKRLI